MESPTRLGLSDSSNPSNTKQAGRQAMQKSLPPAPPHFDRTKSEAPGLGYSSAPAEPSNHNPRSSSSGSLSFQRPKKRVIWRNKGCVIALPVDSEFGQKTNRASYLRPDEVAERLKEWESQGYDTRGFLLSPREPGVFSCSVDGQSRAIHPDPEDERQGREKRNFRVSIPDRQEWERYVDFMKEEKLRALGVSSGDDEPLRTSPAPFALSRQNSSHSSTLVASPASVPVSTNLMQFPSGIQVSSNVMNQRGKPELSHFSRYSMATPYAENSFSPPTQYSSSLSFPMQSSGSHQQLLRSQPASRIASPATTGLGQNLNSTLTTPPLPLQAQVSSHDSWHRQQALMQTQQSQQPQLRRQIKVPPARIQLGEGLKASQMPPHEALDILAPTPQSQRQNTSETLQKEIDGAEYYDESPSTQDLRNSESSHSPPPGPGERASIPLQGSRNPTPNPKMNGSGMEEHSDFAKEQTPSDGASQFPHAQGPIKSSKLNANAPEFKFEAKGLHDPAEAACSVDKHLGHLEDGTPAYTLPKSSAPTKAVHEITHNTKLNVAAPEFRPGVIARKPTIPSQEFSFSASVPTLKPNVPSFEPKTATLAADKDKPNEENPVEAVQKIFGEIPFPEVLKPAKGSKAIPIVKPEAGVEGPGNGITETDGQEDESGRITQADGRQKRMRRAFDNGDQIPLFASATQTPWMNIERNDRAAYFSTSPSSRSEQAEPSTLEAATDLLEEIIDDLSATEASDLLREDESSSEDGKSANSNIARFQEPSPKPDVQHLNVTAEDVAQATVQFLEKSPQFKANFNEALDRRLSGSLSPRLLEEHSSDSPSPLDRCDGINRKDYARQDIIQGVRYVEPSYRELDAIMRHLNEDSDRGIERRPSPFKRRGQSMSPVRSTAPEHYHTSRSPARDPTSELYATINTSQVLPPANSRSDAPSPSPQRLSEAVQYIPQTDSESADTSVLENIERITRGIAKNTLDSPSWPSKNPIPVHRLNSPGSTPPSDWNNALSPVDEDKFHSRAGFFDNRVNDVVGGVVQQRLGPLEQTLSSIQQSLVLLSSRSASLRPRSSGTLEAANSDADDEDDTGEVSQSRLKSPLKDRKYDQLKSIITEISAAQQNFASATQMDEVTAAIKDMKKFVQQPLPLLNGDGNTNADEPGGKQSRGRSAPITSSSVAAVAEKSQLQIAGLETMLKVAEGRADEELKARKSTEDTLLECQKLLESALHDAAEQRESAEATERSLHESSGERQEMLQRTAMLEASNSSLEDFVSQYAKKNTALEDTLAEYRLSHDQWRDEIDDARRENKDLKKHLNSMKDEIDEANEGRRTLRTKFDRLQESMAELLQDTVTEQLRQHAKEGEHAIRLDALSSRLEAEGRSRERLELEIERLEAQEKETMQSRVTNEQVKEANAQLQKIVSELRSECHEQHTIAARYEREAHEAKANTQTEVEYTRNVMDTDIKKIDNQLKMTQSQYESDISRYRKQLEDQAVDAEDIGMKLMEMSTDRDSALKKAAEEREAVLQEHRRAHERIIEDIKSQHERVVNNALEDKERSETYFGHRLNLADEKIEHYKDRTTLLEEKLEIAKSAAQAAVHAAQIKKAPSNPLLNRTIPSLNRSSVIPEKISPQALRESILVLQEQLLERENRIEKLESELSSIDTNAPAKLKDAEVEITWLRELLAVRYDDLQDVIVTLSHPDYDREAVKDAAVRLKANMQMEQQEKERAFAGAQTFPSLSSITNLAASPRALPLAAAAAWGNWRKNRDAGLGNASTLTNGSIQQTPSKSSPQSFFAGLMTPPNTSMRTTPPIPASTRAVSSSSTRIVGMPTTPKHSTNSRNDIRRQQEAVTPPLMRKASYDLDASESVSGFGDEGVEGNGMAGDEDEPFGARLGGIEGAM